MKLSKESLIFDLKKLGVEKGDILFLAADLMRVGYFNINRNQTLTDWIDILIDCVGETGTIIIPSYTESFLKFRKNTNIVFTQNSKSLSGSLSQALLDNKTKYKNFIRSSHPTNSLIGIGAKSKQILEGHDETTSAYLPYHRLVENNAKNLMLGSFDDASLSPMAIHAAQELLGFTKKHFLSGMLQSFYYDKEGVRKKFTRQSVGGCTKGGNKILGYLLKEKNCIKIQKTGRSNSALIDINKSYQLFLKFYKLDNTFFRCENKKCKDCYGSRSYNQFYIFYWVRFILNSVWKQK